MLSSWDFWHRTASSTSLTTFESDELRLQAHGVDALGRWSGLDADAIQQAIAVRAEKLATPPFVP